MEIEKDGPGGKKVRMVQDAEAKEEGLAAELVRELNGRADQLLVELGTQTFFLRKEKKEVER
jgi:hypothetical protein